MTLLAAIMPNRFMRPLVERRAVRRVETGSGPSWTLVGEIDRFRAYADIYGRRFAEDAVLRIREALKDAGSGRTRVYWRDGGAFLAAVSGGSLDHAMAEADELRMAVEALQIPHQGSTLGILTISMGIAGLAGDGEDSRIEAVARAWSALERARASGPNHVLVAGLALS